MLFYYKITVVNSQRKNTISKGDFVFIRIILKKKSSIEMHSVNKTSKFNPISREMINWFFSHFCQFRQLWIVVYYNQNFWNFSIVYRCNLKSQDLEIDPIFAKKKFQPPPQKKSEIGLKKNTLTVKFIFFWKLISLQNSIAY